MLKKLLGRTIVAGNHWVFPNKPIMMQVPFSAASWITTEFGVVLVTLVLYQSHVKCFCENLYILMGSNVK